MHYEFPSKLTLTRTAKIVKLRTLLNGQINNINSIMVESQDDGPIKDENEASKEMVAHFAMGKISF